MSSLEDRYWSCSCASKVEAKHLSGANWLASKAGEMMSIISSVLRSAYGSLHSVRAANLLRRGLVLFTVGASLALVLNLLQVQRKVTLFPEEVMTTLFSSTWWIPPCCGTAAGEQMLFHSTISDLSIVGTSLTLFALYCLYLPFYVTAYCSQMCLVFVIFYIILLNHAKLFWFFFGGGG